MKIKLFVASLLFFFGCAPKQERAYSLYKTKQQEEANRYDEIRKQQAIEDSLYKIKRQEEANRYEELKKQQAIEDSLYQIKQDSIKNSPEYKDSLRKAEEKEIQEQILIEQGYKKNSLPKKTYFSVSSISIINPHFKSNVKVFVKHPGVQACASSLIFEAQNSNVVYKSATFDVRLYDYNHYPLEEKTEYISLSPGEEKIYEIEFNSYYGSVGFIKFDLK
ncbi:MAG: hypothetical protein PHE49_06740 [bacterium]|nr:hypothetical protein [bacterium]